MYPRLIPARELSVNRAAMPIRVDRSSPVPLYFQAAQHLEHMIESGELPMGARLENETDLADQLGLSRPTMRRAIEYLVGRGLLVRKRGIGTQPAPDALAGKLGIAAGTPVYVFERLRFADGEPLALMRNHVPAHLMELAAADLETQGLYNLLRANGIAMRIAKQAIGARVATAAEARALGETKGAPLLTMERSAYDEQGRAVEHGHHLYRASQYSFDLTLTGW